MTTTTSRRAILAGAAMLPVASLPAVASPALTSSEPDPIFAAIEKHHVSTAAFMDRIRYEDSQEAAGAEISAGAR
jgi:hypothetical protein